MRSRAAWSAGVIASCLVLLTSCSSGSRTTSFATPHPDASSSSAAPTDEPPSAAPGASPTASPMTSARRPARCTAAGVRMGLAPGGAAAGTSYDQLLLRATTTCAVRGFLGVSYVDVAGHQVGKPAPRDTRLRVVVPAGREVAIASIGQVNPGNYPAATCRPRTAVGLRIYLPDEFTGVVLRYRKGPVPACSNPTIDQLVVQPPSG